MKTKLKQFTNEYYIKNINIILKYSAAGCYTSGELELESDPVLNDDDNQITLIDYFCDDSISYTMYGGYKNETEFDNGELNYDMLDIVILEEIYNILKSSIETEHIVFNDLYSIADKNNYDDLYLLVNIMYLLNIEKFEIIMKSPSYEIFLKEMKIRTFNI